MKKTVGILPITLSLCGVMIFGIVTYAAINMANGKYRVEIRINKEGLHINSDIDKNQCTPANVAQKKLNE